MIRILVAFLFLFGVYYLGIRALISTTNEEQWKMVKALGYSFICSVLTLGSLLAIVVLF